MELKVNFTSFLFFALWPRHVFILTYTSKLYGGLFCNEKNETVSHELVKIIHWPSHPPVFYISNNSARVSCFLLQFCQDFCTIQYTWPILSRAVPQLLSLQILSMVLNEFLTVLAPFDGVYSSLLSKILPIFLCWMSLGPITILNFSNY